MGSEADTGHSYLEEIQVELKLKNERIMSLEEEVAMLRKREQDLMA